MKTITRDDVIAFAKSYYHHLAIVIVGDRSAVEASLKATGIAPITLIDIEGNPAGN
ncbi:MAG TPA: hypothetical protein VKB05_15590 [Pyrinomonadaceae bacterium]|nr:hypothetical protein [Pyrinomonadaceae bacterium]